MLLWQVTGVNDTSTASARKNKPNLADSPRRLTSGQAGSNTPGRAPVCFESSEAICIRFRPVMMLGGDSRQGMLYFCLRASTHTARGWDRSSSLAGCIYVCVCIADSLEHMGHIHGTKQIRKRRCSLLASPACCIGSSD